MTYKVGMGIQVDRPAEAVALVGTPGDPYFTVAGGLVLITGLIGVCTVAAGGANNMFFRIDPLDAAGANSDITATVDLGTAMVSGDVCVMVGAPATPLLGGHVAVNVVGSTLGKGLAVMSGTIGLVADAALGTFRWVLWYLPIDAGATIVVA